MLGFRGREKQERKEKGEEEGREEEQRQEGGKGTKGGMAFEFVLSILAFFAVAALLGILVYQVNNNPIPFPPLSFLFFYFVGSFSVYKCSCSFFFLNEFHQKEEAPSCHVKLWYLLFLVGGGGGKKEGGKVWAWV
jgi:hypothetical protein